MSGEPLVRVLAHGRLGAGNPLGGVPGLWARVAATGTPPIEDATLAGWLAEIDPNIASEFTATPAPGPADNLAAFARVAAALMASGRSLRILVQRDPAGRGALVLVEEGRALAPARIVATAADLLAAAASGAPAEPFRAPVAACGAPPIKAFLRYAYTLIPERLAARGAGARPALAQKGSLVGEGVGTRLYWFTMGRATGALGAALAARKDTCAQLLARFGLPVPRQIPVADGDAAVAAADAIGYPVVVKPADRSGGAGVAAGLTTDWDVHAAFARAAAVSRRIVVEQMLQGDDHRLTVIGGRMVAAALRVPAEVTGDGVRSIRALVDAVNADPRRGGSRSMLLPIVCGAETDRLLAAAGLTFASVLPAGRRLRLHSVSNLTMGARPVDVTAKVHPDNRAAAIHAAAIIGLDLAGIDFITPDIGRSWREVGGGICEVNREPGLLVHQVAEGGPDMAAACADHLLAPPPAPLVPIVAVLGDGAADAAAIAIAAAMEDAGLAVGLAAGRRLVAAGLPLVDPGPGDPMRVTRLVAHPAVTAVVAAVPPAAIVARGFGHGRADVAVLADAPSDDRDAAVRIMASIGAEIVTGPIDADLVRRIAARRPPAQASGKSSIGRPPNLS